MSFVVLVIPSMTVGTGAAGVSQTDLPMAGGFHWLAFVYALWESFMVVGGYLGLLVLFRTRCWGEVL